MKINGNIRQGVGICGSRPTINSLEETFAGGIFWHYLEKTGLISVSMVGTLELHQYCPFDDNGYADGFCKDELEDEARVGVHIDLFFVSVTWFSFSKISCQSSFWLESSARRDLQMYDW